jgi:threonine/homoserine/homoserine lactone efflux protein
VSSGSLFAAWLAGAIVVLTPGPAVLALFGIGAGQGRFAGGLFLAGHLAGDLLWAVLALVALVWASLLAPWVFTGLAAACGIYLLWLGGRAALMRRDAGGLSSLSPRRPYLRGLAFGLTNPKSYPVTLSVFTALLGGNLAQLTPGNAPLLLAACFAGFLAADLALVWLVGLPPVRVFYRRRETWIVRGTGIMFIGFALSTLAHAF